MNDVRENASWCLMFVLIGMIMGLMLGSCLENHEWERKSVKKGHAEWYLNVDTAEWRWKKCDACKNQEDDE